MGRHGHHQRGFREQDSSDGLARHAAATWALGESHNNPAVYQEAGHAHLRVRVQQTSEGGGSTEKFNFGGTFHRQGSDENMQKS